MKHQKCILFIFLLVGFSSAFAQCYQLVWADEFNYNGAPDLSKWTHEVNGNGGGNNELQYYTNFAENSRVQDSMLIIEARQENYLGKAYTSARLVSYNKASFTYGKMEARIKLPFGQGIWPAFWMLGDNIHTGTGWPACGEIDILEMIGGGEGRDDKVYGTIHWADASGNHAQYGGAKQLNTGIFNDEFHVFAIEWTETSIKWFLDGVQYHVVSITPDHMSEFHNNFFILLNLAVGGNWPGSPDGSTTFPQQMWVDYVRVYQAGAEPQIEGPGQVVKNQSNVGFKLVNDPNFQYQWEVPEGAEIVNGQGTAEVTVNWSCNSDTLKCQLITPCDTLRLQFPVQIKANNITGDAKVSTYQKNNKYEVTSAANTTYSWLLPEGVYSSKIDSSSVRVNWGGEDGILKVVLNNSCGTDTVKMEVTAITQLPYFDAPLSIPGDVLSVYYDKGGEGIAYHDTDAGNNGPGIRQEEDVDTETGDNSGNIGWTYPGEWLEYSIKVEQDGLYDVQCRTAGLTRGGSFRLLMNDRPITDEVVASVANSWTLYRTVYIRNIELFKTDTMLRVEILNGDFNLGNMNFSRVGTAVNDTKKIRSVQIHPTRVKDFLSIKNLDQASHYTIFNVSGNVIKSGELWPIDMLEVGDLNPGIYVFILENETGSITQKFLKVNL